MFHVHKAVLYRRRSNVVLSSSQPRTTSLCKAVLAGSFEPIKLNTLTCSARPCKMSTDVTQATSAQFGQYHRPRTLSTGDLGDMGIGGDGTCSSHSGHGHGSTNSGGQNSNSSAITFARLAGALESGMEKIHSSEMLRSLLRLQPVTCAALQSVNACLALLPSNEVTRILVSSAFAVAWFGIHTPSPVLPYAALLPLLHLKPLSGHLR